MKRERFLWGVIGALTLACLLALVSDALAQGSHRDTYRTLARGQIAVSITGSGAMGRKDDGVKQEPHGFSYPKGRSPIVYAGGWDRAAWNISHNSAGDGVWLLTRTGGTPRVSHSGGQTYSSDIKLGTYDATKGPEKGLGTPYTHTHPLAMRTSGGGAWHSGVNLDGVVTNYWPGVSVPVGHPANIWNFNYYSYNSKEAAAFPQAINISQWSTGQGLTVTRKAYQFGHQDYDDSVIFDYVVENTSGKDVADAYISFQARFDPSSMGATWRGSSYGWYGPGDLNRDTWLRNTRAANFSGPASAKDLALMYAYDGDSDQVPWDDRGDPWFLEFADGSLKRTQSLPEGMLQSPQYFGYGLIDATPPFNIPGGADPGTYVSPKDNPATPLDESKSQPASTQWFRVTTTSTYDTPNEGKDSDPKMYDLLTAGGHKDEPGEGYAFGEFMTFGPYDLKAGEKFKVVMAYAGGIASQNAKYQNNPATYAQPFEFDWMLRGNQAELALGEDALVANFRKAMEAYTWSYAIPQQPPDLKLTWDSDLKGQNIVKWSTLAEQAENPAYAGAEAKDIVGYRVYSSSKESRGPFKLRADIKIADAKAGKLPAGVTFSADEQWRTIKSTAFPDGVPLVDDKGQTVKGTYTFTDTESKAGFPSWYQVRPYTSGHADFMGRGKLASIESSADLALGTIGGSDSGIVPKVPSSPVFDQFTEKVRVVPNPFRVDDPARTYTDKQTIRFTNLPRRSQIDIYDVTGQRIWTFFHDSLTSGEEPYIQLSENRPSNFGSAMLPGIYFWKVTSLMKESMGKIQNGTFLIIK
ncbi:MAG: hypothetical protein A3F84_21260 [Candidatus Handelsmanbacteria bacterium RIFCSPLOWO2_12_FULL_64_10]|uniref:Secretion system C-terminal sorting domain-containing protein n=1 Tax=Handelsmanbacteria sp. (strain RIFCSPLOWO2_12_FULL_64_10) TaxID=1817868 RepID=A0A1F6D697_HANXR|nr:MAG: hypothetical protein A3F84_21260 [Candidatus Handelsmanbacteria bacterium RIFCSPLOWO2_12_FULL_64_10]